VSVAEGYDYAAASNFATYQGAFFFHSFHI